MWNQTDESFSLLFIALPTVLQVTIIKGTLYVVK